MTSSQVKDVLVAAGVPADSVFTRDRFYQLPTEHWVERHLGPTMDSFLFQTGFTYLEDLWDCNKFASTVAIIASWAWAATALKRAKETGAPPPRASLALGTFAYWSEMDPHELVFAIHLDDAKRPYVRWYEPQPGVKEGGSAFTLVSMTPRTITPEQAKTCILCEFY